MDEKKIERIIGCQHNEKAACEECLKLLASGEAQLIPEGQALPEPGESLEHYTNRMAELGIQVDAKQAGVGSQEEEVSVEEMKRRIKDETIPEPIRRYWRQRLYGPNSGRKEFSQGRALQEQNSLKDNLTKRVMHGMARNAGKDPDELKRDFKKQFTGKERKRARCLYRQGQKVAKSAA